jgi:ribosomal protein S27AE
MTDKETKYKLRLEKRGLDIPIDKTATNYRCCPNCSIGFMADDQKQLYCCQKCHDDFNNAKLKEKTKEMKAKLEEILELSDTCIPFKKNRIMQLKQSNAFLEKIHPGDNSELLYPIKDLIKNGVDLSVFEDNILLGVGSDDEPRYSITIRSFEISYKHKNSVLIKINKK